LRRYARRSASSTRPKAATSWFALDESRPLAVFAGIWTRWTSVRKVKEGETTNDLFGFLTTEPNGVVAPIHPKAMPVNLAVGGLLSARFITTFSEAL
jgi:putative SOS response-associated peptidase YedK